MLGHRSHRRNLANNHRLGGGSTKGIRIVIYKGDKLKIWGRFCLYNTQIMVQKILLFSFVSLLVKKLFLVREKIFEVICPTLAPTKLRLWS